MWFKKKTEFISPITGTLLPLSQVNDPTFAEGMMGPGFAIIPKESELYAPCNGIIKMIFPTKHAIGIQCADGKELLLHIGIDTVALNGEGFTVHVAQGDRIKAGDKLMTIDLPFIKEKGYDSVIICALPNESDFTISNLPKEIHKGDPIK